MGSVITLPDVERQHGLAGLLSSRRSTKSFDAAQALSTEDVAAFLWAAAGSTTPPHRSCPSARATNPITITLITGRVTGLEPGCYRYDSIDHALVPGLAGDRRDDIAAATLDAGGWLNDCPALLLLTTDLDAARRRFQGQPAEHGERFVWMEAGHSAENIYLLAAEKDFGTCLVAGLNDEAMRATCRSLIPLHHRVLGVLGIGRAD